MSAAPTLPKRKTGKGVGPGVGTGSTPKSGSTAAAAPGDGSGPAPRPAPQPGTRPGPRPGKSIEKRRARQANRAPRQTRALTAEFVAAVAASDDVAAGPPEVALCGRSNVGKSSLVNALCQQKALASTSRTPGRTRRICLFDVVLDGGQTVRLVDFPGFGHAEVPLSMRDEFAPMIQGYLEGQTQLRAVVVLIDSRRDTDSDAVGFVEWLHEQRLPVVVVATKIDKIPKNLRFPVLARMKRDFGLQRPPLGVSTVDGDGVQALRLAIRDVCHPRVPGKKGSRVQP